MKTFILPLLTSMMSLLMAFTAGAQDTIDFESLNVPARGYFNGAVAAFQDTSSFMEDTVVNYENTFKYDNYFTSWYGFSFSNEQNDSTVGYSNQYSAYLKSQELYDEFGTYAVGYISTYVKDSILVTFDSAVNLDQFYVANTTYAYMAMKYGEDGTGFIQDSFQTANNDSLVLQIEGFDENGTSTGTVKAYLAKFTGGDAFVLDSFARVDLSSLNKVESLSFKIQSSDAAVPTYFCMDSLAGSALDNVTLTSGTYKNGSDKIKGAYDTGFSAKMAQFNTVFSINNWGSGITYTWNDFAYSHVYDTNTVGQSNQYSAFISGDNYTRNGTFVVSYISSSFMPPYNPIPNEVVFDSSMVVKQLDVANSAYTYLAMKYGEDGSGFVQDSFMTQFHDSLVLEIKGYNSEGQVTDSMRVYLAKFTNGDAYIVNDWKQVNLTKFGAVNKLSFVLESSDASIPSYFCMDNLVVEKEATGIRNGIAPVASAIDVYPNPCTNRIFVKHGFRNVNGVVIRDMAGKLVMVDQSIQAGSSVDVSGLKTGMYMVMIQTNHGTVVRKVIKK